MLATRKSLSPDAAACAYVVACSVASRADAMEMANGDIIDGEDEKRSSFPRYVNHSVRRANCVACDAWESSSPMAAVYLETSREIKPDEELLFDCARTARTLCSCASALTADAAPHLTDRSMLDAYARGGDLYRRRGLLGRTKTAAAQAPHHRLSVRRGAWPDARGGFSLREGASAIILQRVIRFSRRGCLSGRASTLALSHTAPSRYYLR